MSASPDPPARAIDGLPREAAAGLSRAGLNLLGALAAETYERVVPEGWRTPRVLDGARSALVLGSGGGALAERALAAGGADPVDRAAARASTDCVAAFEARGERARAFAYHERLDASGVLSEHGAFADFVELGRLAGLGAPGRLRILLHPDYGPWIAVRAVVLTTARLAPTAPLEGFAPCAGCPAPCRDACPAGALDAGDLDWARCGAQRRRAARAREAGDADPVACAHRCAARRACVLGREHAYPLPTEAHFMRTSLRIALDSGA